MQQENANSWYIARSDGLQGPLDQREFRTLVKTGQVTAATLIWSPGLTDWVTYDGYLKAEEATLLDSARVSAQASTRASALAAAHAAERTAADRLRAAIPAPMHSASSDSADAAASGAHHTATGSVASFNNGMASDSKQADVVWIDVEKFPFAAPKANPSPADKWYKSPNWHHSAKRAISPGRVAIAAILIVASAALYEWFTARAVFDNLPISTHDQRRLSAIASLPTSESRVAIAVSHLHNIQTPSFVIAGNFSQPRKLQVRVEGRPEAVVGKLRYSVEAEVQIHNRVALTPPLDALNPGFYAVSVFDRALGKKPLGETTVFLGGSNDQSYQDAITEFRKTINARKQAERIELAQITDVLQQQLNESTNRYAHFSRPKDAKSWAAFDLKWNQLFAQLRASMAQKSSAEVVMITDFIRLSSTLDTVDKVHRQQHKIVNNILTGTAESETDRQALAKLLLQANQDLHRELN